MPFYLVMDTTSKHFDFLSNGGSAIKKTFFSNFNHNKCLDKTVAYFKKPRKKRKWKDESSKENKVVKIVVFVSSWLLTFCVPHSTFLLHNNTVFPSMQNDIHFFI